MSVSDYSTNPDLNTSISSINIAEGCLPGNLNNAIRQLMADVASFSSDVTSQISTAETELQASLDKGTFIGEIKLWSGSITNGHPVVNGTTLTNWQLCDGTSSTPNLTGRFVLAATATDIGETGGTSEHTHANSTQLTIDNHTLSVAEMPVHSHSIKMHNRHWTAIASHDGNFNDLEQTGGPISTENAGGSNGVTQGHNHTGSVTVTNTSTSHIPVYYKLAYIMRTA